jgi:hypothetical protein
MSKLASQSPFACISDHAHHCVARFEGEFGQIKRPIRTGMSRFACMYIDYVEPELLFPGVVLPAVYIGQRPFVRVQAGVDARD